MSSEHNFSQRVIDENYNKTLRNDLSSEDLNKLRSYFKTALSEMVGQWNNPNVQLSRNALENISKRENEILANINTNHKANNPPNTIFGKLIYYLNRTPFNTSPPA
ncbi:hypothetical protein GCM10027046_35270 [Uliginosibacterium flavum]|uniref:hypothetical protein n=1 Tax=Uliginosibacterium flavum TaxID=1396831 RepID=UPI00339C1B29